MTRLISLATHGVPGLPDTEVRLLPMTALVGPRGSGKSRLLAALSWLLTGVPALGSADAHAELSVEALVDDDGGGDGERRIVRGPGIEPVGALPSTMLLAAPDRLGLLPDQISGQVDLSPAEVVIAWLEARIRRGDRGAVVLIEEPELDLNPQAQRYLYRVMRDFAAHNQVIYSTRSAAFVDAVHHDEIVRLDITGSGMAIRRASSEVMSDNQRLRLAAEFNHERGEMFFANAVVLVEGQTEAQVLPIIFRALGHDPDAMGIAITEVGGKGNLVLVARVLAALNIPHLIVHDSDRGRPGAAENKQIALAVGKTPRIQLDPDFEGAAGIHHRSDKVLHGYARFANAPPEKIPPVFQRIVRTAVRLARRSGRPRPPRA